MDVDMESVPPTAAPTTITLSHPPTVLPEESNPQHHLAATAAAAEAEAAAMTEPSLMTTEDRLDAVLADNDSKMTTDGYESSDLESSDDDDDDPVPASSESDSDSDSESDIEGLPTTSLTIEQREKALIELGDMEEDDEEGGRGAAAGFLRTKNEVVQLPEVTKPQIELTADKHLEEIGAIYAMVDNVVVVEAANSGDVSVLDAGSVVVVVDQSNPDKAEKIILGEIFETFGPVVRPLYSIRFNNATDIPTCCKVGTKVYNVREHSSVVLTQPLKALKGSDASNRYDEEVDEVELEFSDDEKEMEHKRLLKSKRKGPAGPKDKTPRMSADELAALQAISGDMSSTLPQASLPMEDGYRILQRPTATGGSASSRGGSHGGSHRGGHSNHAHSGVSSLPWYQQQQREVHRMMGTTPQQPQQFQQQQQEQQRHQQQQQLQYQMQIQQAQETLRRLQEQQEQIRQLQEQHAMAAYQRQHQQQAQASQPVAQAQPFPQYNASPSFSNPSFSPLQPMNHANAYPPQDAQSAQQQQQQQQRQQIMNALANLYPTQHQPGQDP
ncbi:hypothetical protein BGZ73_007251 [Actinomortierella ambigua]|nr:hypothetical protein BGZ73_007251 [Actinomortierella ambigua]